MASSAESPVHPDEHFFEGAEKLFEIWLDSRDGKGDLRTIERYQCDLFNTRQCEAVNVFIGLLLHTV